MSPNRPASTVEMVSANRYDVTTQLMCPAPPRSPTMVGRAVETMVWSRAESSMPSMTVTNTRFICVRPMGGRARVPGPVATVWVMARPSHGE